MSADEARVSNSTFSGVFFSIKYTTSAALKLYKMTNGGRCNFRKYIEIKGSDKYITLYISLKFGSMEKTRITS